ncbi:hypothetical protein HDC33_000222 [Sporosarcina sp. JAI121]|nr:hypothetical protein [Sporosarcina sp. JAI121]
MESLFGLKILKVDWSNYGRDSGLYSFASKLTSALVEQQGLLRELFFLVKRTMEISLTR